MALQLIKISEFPQEVDISSVEWIPLGKVDGEAFKVSFSDFVNNFEFEVAQVDFTNDVFSI